MDRKYVLRRISLGLLAAAGLWFALPGRAPAAAFEAGQAQKQQVKHTLTRFRDRLNVKDIRALVGQLPDEPKPKGFAGKLHHMVTTAEAEYTVAERKAIRDELKALFRQIPPEVQMFFKPLNITVSGGRATVECQYYFKAKTPTQRSKRFVNRRGRITFTMTGHGGVWKVRKVKGVVEEVREGVEQR